MVSYEDINGPWDLIKPFKEEILDEINISLSKPFIEKDIIYDEKKAIVLLGELLGWSIKNHKARMIDINEVESDVEDFFTDTFQHGCTGLSLIKWMTDRNLVYEPEEAVFLLYGRAIMAAKALIENSDIYGLEEDDDTDFETIHKAFVGIALICFIRHYADGYLSMEYWDYEEKTDEEKERLFLNGRY